MDIFSICTTAIIGLSTFALTILCAWKWKGNTYLCDDCIFNNAQDCLKSERPCAIECYAYKKK